MRIVSFSSRTENEGILTCGSGSSHRCLMLETRDSMGQPLFQQPTTNRISSVPCLGTIPPLQRIRAPGLYLPPMISLTSLPNPTPRLHVPSQRPTEKYDRQFRYMMCNVQHTIELDMLDGKISIQRLEPDGGHLYNCYHETASSSLFRTSLLLQIPNRNRLPSFQFPIMCNLKFGPIPSSVASSSDAICC